jgi:hypothetical protein
MTNSEQKHPARQMLFIVGTGRCGSTLVAEVLARHPEFGFISNLDMALPKLNLMGRWNNWLYRATPRSLTQRDRHKNASRNRFRQSKAHFGPSEAWSLLNKYVSATVSMPYRDLVAEDATPWLSKRCRAFFEDRANVQGKAVFMHKFTGWPRLGFLHKVFPEAKFLHVVRDGRSVANSLIQMPWWFGYLGTSNWKFGELPDKYQQEWDASGNSFPVLAGIEWKMMMDAFDGTKHIVPRANCMELRYEDMVEQPRESTKRLLDFVGLEWTRGFESNFSRHSFGANKAGYLKDLSAKDVAQLEESLAGHLRQRGYEVGPGSQQIGEALGARETNVSQVEIPVLSA